MKAIWPDTRRPKIDHVDQLGSTYLSGLYSHVTDTMQADAAARLDTAFQTAKTRLKGQS